jgi:hypothetical protein
MTVFDTFSYPAARAKRLVAKLSPAMWASHKRSATERHHCLKCREDLTDKSSVGGRLGNECIQCYCQRVNIKNIDVILGAITIRRCCQCDFEYDENLAFAEERNGEIRGERQSYLEYGRDLAIKPAVIGYYENGTFRGLLCYRCRFKQDYNYDLANKKKFEEEKQLYEKKCAEWEMRYGVQMEGNANEVAVVTFLILACLVYDSTNKWDLDGGGRFGVIFVAAGVGANIARFLAKEVLSALFVNPSASSIPPSPEKEPPTLQLPEKRACGYPELLFDGNKDAVLNSKWEGIYYDEPPDWEERRNICRQRDNFFCCLCGEKKRLHVHHIIPKGKLYKGSHSLQNLVTLCQDCHAAQEYYDHKHLMEIARSRNTAT